MTVQLLHFRLRRLFLASLLALTATVLQHSARASISLPSGFVSEVVVGGLNKPTAIAFSSDGRMFIAQKDGLVRVFQNGGLLPTPFIDLRSEVNDYWDRGLLGLALHPDFPNTRYVYLLYSWDPAGSTEDGSDARVSRLLRVEADAANTSVASTAAGARTVLLGANSSLAHAPQPCFDGINFTQDCLPADGNTHTIGTLAFGKDGSLYVSNGDGTWQWQSRVQDLNSLSGKILRINPLNGQGYSNNPYFDGNPNSNRSKVVSYGLRNPFRFTLHPQSNELFIGDVGYSTWEEINRGAGRNFGWPCYEGGNAVNVAQYSYASDPRCQALWAQGESAVTPAVYAWDHNVGSSAQAGAIYSGSAYPAQYHDALFVMDYSGDWIKALVFDQAGNATALPFISDASDGNGGPVQMLAGPDTNLYYVTLSYNWLTGEGSGEVRRIRYISGGNSPPVARMTANPSDGAAPLAVQFNAGASSDPDGGMLSYLWRFGDGGTATSVNPLKTYVQTGVYDARLTVTDSGGLTSTAAISILVGNTRPVVTITLPVESDTYEQGSTIQLQGQATDAEDGTLGNSALSWRVMTHHSAHTHFDIAPGLTGANASFTAPAHEDNSYLEICLLARDSGNASSQRCVSMQPRKTPLALLSQPGGMELAYDGATRAAPYTAMAIVNSQHTVAAPSVQGCYSFVNWNDGSTQLVRPVSIASQPLTLTVNYVFNPAICADLIGHWRFEEGAGITAMDSTVHSNTATLSNSTWAPGKFGKALKLSGATNSAASVSASSSLSSLTRHFTAAAWVYRDASQSGLSSIVGRQFGSSWSDQWLLGFYDSGFAYHVNTRDSGATEAIWGGAPVQNWIHVAGVYDGNMMSIYVDGALLYEAPKTGLLQTDGNPLIIGGNENDANTGSFQNLFMGRIDDLRVYRRALSASEIQALASALGPPSSPEWDTLTPGNGKITVSWKSADAATGYTLRWGSASGMLTQSITLSSTQAVVNGLTNGQTYYFQIEAINAQGASIGFGERFGVPNGPVPTATLTPSPTRTATRTPTATPSPTPSPTVLSATPTRTATPSPSPSPAAPSATPTPTPTRTATPSPSPTAPSATPTPTPTRTATPSPSPTALSVTATPPRGILTLYLPLLEQ